MRQSSRIMLIIMISHLNACQEQLDVENPNAPQFSIARTETGILNFAMGAVYVAPTKYSGAGFLWNEVQSFHEVMGDAVGTDLTQLGLNQIGCPERILLDNGSSMPNPHSPANQKGLIRQMNVNQNAYDNPLFYEWTILYSINNGCNMLLSLVDDVELSGDSTARPIKKDVIRVWANFWKGYAYSRIGSIYYAGIINDVPLKTNNKFVTKEAIIAEAEENLSAAELILNDLSSGGIYDQTLGKLIPNICQVGNGGILTPGMWKRNINTLRARNILVNTPVASMSTSQWNRILQLTQNGIQSTDKIFTVRSNATSDLMNPSTGNLPARTRIVGGPNGPFKVSERLIQDFKPGDLRLVNNFVQTQAWIGDANRGNSFNTRWDLRNGGGGMDGVVVMQDLNAGAYELYLAGFHEENELMKAEAFIFLGDVEAGLAVIDNVRNFQGAGLAAVAGTGLSQAQAISELRSERRVALAFRGLSFYDARRYGIINDGRTGAVVVDNSGTVNTNATILYNFLDYWDVPDNEVVFNPPAPGTAPVKNPNGL